ncbi:MAG TPA: hypothetical protein VJ867_09540 [Gemmatimonadaceae bacterium]|nr:hypothetical protein [Gemmatimonadaceae bacterium]
MTHLTFEELSELSEHRLPSAEAADHLATCPECRAAVQRLRNLLATAHALPRDVAPPEHVWTAVRDRWRREQGAPVRASHVWVRPLLVAASIVLVAGVATIGLMSRGQIVKRSGDAAAPAHLVSAVQTLDRNYGGTIAELRSALESRRDALSPHTVRTVDRALTIIDSAIVEARAALAADPANQALMDILSAHYQREVDLLQRATELSSS